MFRSPNNKAWIQSARVLLLTVAFFCVFRIALCHGVQPGQQQEDHKTIDPALAALKPDDPKLEHIYRTFFQSLEGRADGPASIVADIRSRGNSISTLLLNLFDENFEGSVRENIVFWFDEFQGLPIDPFRNRIRDLIEHDPKALPRKSCVYFARFLSKHGTSHDVPLLQSMISLDPQGEIGLRVGHFLQILRERLVVQPNGEQPASILKPAASIVTKQVEVPSSSKQTPPKGEPTSSTPWSIIAVLIVAAGCLMWLLLKRRS